jgi:hypothetical protein
LAPVPFTDVARPLLLDGGEIAGGAQMVPFA